MTTLANGKPASLPIGRPGTRGMLTAQRKGDYVAGVAHAHRHPALGSRISAVARRRPHLTTVAVLAAHAALALGLRASELASTLYTATAVIVALAVTLTARRIEVPAIAAAYLVGAEVLWRMTGTHAFWETGKYATVAVLAVALWRWFPGWRRIAVPAVYLAMFVPAAVVSAQHFGLRSAREPISFNLSGPLALAVAVMFFSQVRTTVPQLRNMLRAVVPPITAIATIVLADAIRAGTIEFTFESNLATSGGFGPNQVSAALGFGVLACLVLVLTETDRWLRFLAAALALWFFSHALLTFARGGVANVVVAVLLGLLASATSALRPTRLRRIALPALGGAVVIALAGVVLLPRLNDFTGGHLLVRYEETEITERDAIVRDDLDQFREDPVFGVGLGVSQKQRAPAVSGKVTHTEFSRLLAEQGVFGVVALLALVAIAANAVRRARPGTSRALACAFIGWSFAEMAHSATRLALTSYVLGLAVGAAGLVIARDDGLTTKAQAAA